MGTTSTATKKISTRPLNQDIFEYQRKNDKAALPKRVFNKKKAAAQKKADVAKYINDLD